MFKHCHSFATRDYAFQESRSSKSARCLTRTKKSLAKLLWLSLITRLDITFAVSLLPRFASNPSPVHFRMINHLLGYVRNTLDRAFFSPNIAAKQFQLFTDASYADDPDDRHSSQELLLKLFGAPIFWRATKQSVVTTSSTEAELLALSHGTKEAYYQSRLFAELHLHLQIKAFCDNMQTLNLILKAAKALNSRLKHIDVYNHWLRHEAVRHDRQHLDECSPRCTTAIPSSLE